MQFEDQIGEVKAMLAHAVEFDSVSCHEAAAAAMAKAIDQLQTLIARQYRRAEALAKI